MTPTKHVSRLPWEAYQHKLKFFKLVARLSGDCLQVGDTYIEVGVGRKTSSQFRPDRHVPLLEALVQLESFQEIYTEHGDWVEQK